MNNTKLIRRVIVLIIAVAIAIGFTISTVNDSLSTQVALGKEYSFEDDYNLYTEYADDYVKTWDKSFLKDENVTISSSIHNGFIKVVVDGEISKLEARYPIKVEVKEEKSETVVFYKNGTYEKLSNVPSEFIIELILVLYFLLKTVTYYYIISLIIWIVNEVIKSSKEKIYQNMKQKEENNNKMIIDKDN